MPARFNINTNDSNLNQTQKFDIEGNKYFLNTYYNSRILDGDDFDCGSWYIDLLDSQQVVIMTGIKLMPNRFIFDIPQLREIFTGHLICVDTDNDLKTQKMTANNYGDDKRFELWYFSASEVG